MAMIYEVVNNVDAYSIYVTIENEGNLEQKKFATKWKASIAEGSYLTFKEVEVLLKHIDYTMPNFLQIGEDKPINPIQ